MLDQLGTTVLLTIQTLAWTFRTPFRVGQLFLAMEFIGVQSIFIIALTGTFSGMVLALQMVHSFKQFQAEGLVGGVVALSLTREISPVFTGLMVTARAGSAWAAELGNMRVTEQIDAITTMGVSPVQYLLSPRLIAAVLMVPLLCVRLHVRGDGRGMAGGGRVACTSTPASSSRAPSSTPSPKIFHGGDQGVRLRLSDRRHLVPSRFLRFGRRTRRGRRHHARRVQSAVAILVANYVLTSWLTTPDCTSRTRSSGRQHAAKVLCSPASRFSRSCDIWLVFVRVSRPCSCCSPQRSCVVRRRAPLGRSLR